MFEDLGIKYVGPVDGHDIAAVESRAAPGQALRRAGDRARGDPQGLRLPAGRGRRGRQPAQPAGAFDPQTGEPTGPAVAELDQRVRRRAGRDRRRAARHRRRSPPRWSSPTGIATLAATFPERAFDVGIAEQHAITSAAGLALGGLHPVVAVYATFLNRAFDQVLLDVALHRLPVTFVLDRAGVTGPDGPSHYGIWDLSIFGVVPGLRIAAPRDAATLREELREAVAVDDGPTIVRFPTGAVLGRPAARCAGSAGSTCCASPPSRSNGEATRRPAGVRRGVRAAGRWPRRRRLAEQGFGVTVVDPRWVRPVPAELVGLAAEHRLVVDGRGRRPTGGVGAALAAALRDAEVDVPVRDLGVPQRFLEHGSRAEVLADLGLTAQDVARRVTEWASGARRGIPTVGRGTERIARHRGRRSSLAGGHPGTMSRPLWHGGDVRVLVVEDERPLADAIARGLRREGMAVDVAYDGDDGHEKSTITRYDVVVLDRDLPGHARRPSCAPSSSGAGAPPG